MKIFGSLLYAIVLSVNLIAQNYRAYIPQRPAFFHTNSGNNFWYYESSHGVSEDSVWNSGSRRIVRSYPEELPTNSSMLMNCLVFDTTWIGTRIEQDTITGETWFFNYEGDTIRFYPAAAVGQTGMYCRMVNGNVMRGVVNSVTPMNVMTVNDSVKIVVLNYEDANGNPLFHNMNNKPIYVSRQFGISHGYRWSDFPSDTASLTLYGMENPGIGGHTINAAQIYDFAIGDRFDWVEGNNTNAMQFPTMYWYYSRTITAKTVSGDTITYNYIEDHVQKIGTTILSQQWGITGVWQINTAQQDAFFDFNDRPYDLIQYPDSTMITYTLEYATMPYAPTMVNGRQLKGFETGWPYYWDSDSSCFIAASLSFGPCDGYHTVFGEGIGKVYHFGGSAICYANYNLVYFSKGNETWGTPHNWSIILADEESGYHQNPSMEIYPNPAENVVNITIPDYSSQKAVCRIYSISGQLISETPAALTSGKAQIPVNQLESGLYMIAIGTENGLWQGRFVR